MAEKLTSLKKQIADQNYREALSLVNECLQSRELSAKKNDLLLVKLVCLIGEEEFKSAVELIDSFSTDPLKQTSLPQKGYCLYKLGKLIEADEVIQRVKSAKSNGVGDALRHVEAQIAYKLNDYSRAAEIYGNLLAKLSKDDAEYAEIAVNYQACLVGSKMTCPISSKDINSMDTDDIQIDIYDSLFNQACLDIAKGNYNDAQNRLERALELVKETGYSEKDIQNESLIIKCQLAVVKALSISDETSDQELLDEFEQLLSVLSPENDYATYICVLANFIRLSLPKSRKYLSEKYNWHALTTGKGIENKLNGWQEAMIRCNHASIFSFHGKKARARHQYLKAFQANPYDDVAAMIKLLWLVRAGIGKGNTIDPAVIESGKNMVLANASPRLIQFFLDMLVWKKQYAVALDLIIQLPDKVKKTRQILKLAVQLSVKLNDLEKGRLVLEEATTAAGENSKDASEVNKMYAFYLETANNPQKSVQVFESLLRKDASNIKLLAGLVKGYAKSGQLEKSDSYVKLLDAKANLNLKRLNSREDLEQVWALASSMKSKTYEVKTKKKRGKRVLRHAVPEDRKKAKPDPERWIPKKLRTKNRRKQSTATGSSNDQKTLTPSNTKEKLPGGSAGGGGRKKKRGGKGRK